MSASCLRPSGLLLLALVGLLGACGDEPAMDDAGSCGPHGDLHRRPGGDPHCHCDDGFEPSDGVCVASPAPPPLTSDPSPSPSEPDCGPNGQFDGRACDCDSGYTQTGIDLQRTCTAIPACSGGDDAHEPNDQPQDATGLDQVSGELYACPANPDWYIFAVRAGDRVAVEIRFEGERVDLDLLLYGPSSRDPRAFSLGSSGDAEQATFMARADGTAGILVMPYGIGEGSYQVRVDIEEGEAPMCGGPGASCSVAADCCSRDCHINHCH